MNIIEAVKDEHLFRPFLADRKGSIASWNNWLAALRVVYGLPVPRARQEVVGICTGRDVDLLPRDGFDTALFLTGRRSGKSRIAAVIGAFEAALAGHESKLAKGEQGLVACISPTRRQSNVVKKYIRGIFETPMLAQCVEDETREGIELSNGLRIETLAGDYRTVRGMTLIAAVVDEICFFGLDDESKIRSDSELIRAIKPSLINTRGKLICISSPYAKRGWCFKQYETNFGNDRSKTLVWNCPSRTMNPTLPQSVIDDALAEDMAAAKAEYLGEFRDDVGLWLSRAVIEALVVPGRHELMPKEKQHYYAFADLSGGRVDEASIAIASRHDRTVVIDLLHRWRPPFNPYEVIAQMAEVLKRYEVKKVVGDNYSAEFVARAFEACGLRYEKSDKPKAMLYAELLPRMCSGEIELPDDQALVDQLANLERRTRSGGRDIIDHPKGGHDDLANAVAGVADIAAKNLRVVGAL